MNTRKVHTSKHHISLALKLIANTNTRLTVHRDDCPDKGYSEAFQRLTDDGTMLVSWNKMPISDKTIAEVTKTFAAFHQEWLESKEHAVLVEQLKTLKERHSGTPVTNVVAMATGTLVWGKRASALQVASVLTIMEVLGGMLHVYPCCTYFSYALQALRRSRTVHANFLAEPGKPLPCIIQDPVYSKTCKEILTSLGLRVVDDPDAFSLINSSSLVYFLGTPACVPRWVSLGPRPLALFCQDHSDLRWRFGRSHPDRWFDSVYLMFDDYEELEEIEGKASNEAFLASGKKRLFSGGRLWWRKPVKVKHRCKHCCGGRH